MCDEEAGADAAAEVEADIARRSELEEQLKFLGGMKQLTLSEASYIPKILRSLDLCFPKSLCAKESTSTSTLARAFVENSVKSV